MALGELVNGTIGVIFMVKDAYDQRRRYRDKAASTRELAEKIGTVATLEFPHAVPEEPYEDSPTEDIVSGTSQISAAGKACIPLGVLYRYLTTSIISDNVLQPNKMGEKNIGGTTMPVAKDRVKGYLTDRVKGYLAIGLIVALFALVILTE